MVKLIIVSIAIMLLSALMPLPDGSALPSISDKNLVVQQIADGFDKPSGFEFIGRDILVIQKDDAKVKLVRDFNLKKASILDANAFNIESDSGLLGITSVLLDDTTYVFIFLTENHEIDGGKKFDYGLGNRVYRYEWDANSLELRNPKLIADLPSAPAPIDTGGKLLVGPDGQLYVLIGDMLREGKEQNMPEKDPSIVWPYDNKTITSGILRITIDGFPSQNNPFHEYGFEQYYAYGIRYPSGLAVDPLTGNLWDLERGPKVFDELNLVKPGFNSGWKQIQGRTTDVCCVSDYFYASRLSQDVNKLYNIPGSYYDEPKYVWPEAPAVSALIFMNSRILKDYENDLIVGDMQGNIYRFMLDAKRENISVNDDSSYVLFGSGFGSISDMKIGPDGALYVLTYSNKSGFPIGSNTGSIYRIAYAPLELPGQSQILGADYYAIVSILATAISVPVGIIIWKRNSGRRPKIG